MDLYLPDEFYALSESPNPRRTAPSREDSDWLGGEAFLSSPLPPVAPRMCEPDPIWLVV